MGLTATQFDSGLPAVLVSPKGDPRYLDGHRLETPSSEIFRFSMSSAQSLGIEIANEAERLRIERDNKPGTDLADDQDAA